MNTGYEYLKKEHISKSTHFPHIYIFGVKAFGRLFFGAFEIALASNA